MCQEVLRLQNQQFESLEFKRARTSINDDPPPALDAQKNPTDVAVTLHNAFSHQVLELKYDAPVSYTHLDVYKRQVYMWFIGLLQFLICF